MNIHFRNAEALMEGISLVSSDLGITVCSNAPVNVTVTETEEDVLSVTLKENDARITYGGGKARFFRGLSMLVCWLKDGVKEKSALEHPLFTMNGAMLDVSRNAVANLPTLKFWLRSMARMGMNTFMLYTEDTYEIEGRPYFGYMRGRYTREEIREIDAYAQTLGIELIPCIQFLGHLDTHLRWGASGAYRDTERVLLVGAEETYKLIDDMLSAIAECFTSRRIHVGMDETFGLGTGAYLKKNGYRDHREIYFEHLQRVTKMAVDRGFRPMMWSDMFFRMYGEQLPDYGDYDPRTELPEDIGKFVPEGMQQVFWDYYNPEESFYAVNLDKHDLLGKNTVFAGGVWMFTGHCPHYSRSLRNSIPALEACRKKGTKEIFCTVWHNGAESSLVLALAGLAWYADYDYTGRYDEDSVRTCFRYSCDADYDDFLKTEQPEYPYDGDVGISRSVLYNDPLLGLWDKHIAKMQAGDYYRSITPSLTGIGEGFFAPAFRVIEKFSSLLENKSDFGVRLKTAYDTGDRNTLAALAEECDLILSRIRALRDAHRESWMLYNKPFGWEVLDIRYGGMLMRFDTVKLRIGQYLRGEIERLEELEAERLRFDCKEEDAPIDGWSMWNGYRGLSTAGIL